MAAPTGPSPTTAWTDIRYLFSTSRSMNVVEASIDVHPHAFFPALASKERSIPAGGIEKEGDGAAGCGRGRRIPVREPRGRRCRADFVGRGAGKDQPHRGSPGTSPVSGTCNRSRSATGSGGSRWRWPRRGSTGTSSTSGRSPSTRGPPGSRRAPARSRGVTARPPRTPLPGRAGPRLRPTGVEGRARSRAGRRPGADRGRRSQRRRSARGRGWARGRGRGCGHATSRGRRPASSCSTSPDSNGRQETWSARHSTDRAWMNRDGVTAAWRHYLGLAPGVSYLPRPNHPCWFRSPRYEGTHTGPCNRVDRTSRKAEARTASTNAPANAAPTPGPADLRRDPADGRRHVLFPAGALARHRAQRVEEAWTRRCGAPRRGPVPNWLCCPDVIWFLSRG